MSYCSVPPTDDLLSDPAQIRAAALAVSTLHDLHRLNQLVTEVAS